ncbi:MAG: PEP-CTERM sorting domain-containing protein [Planctomycetia bacterium]|nr:PEP-CTERM sorting domain-containing protein [Planctomycetia bacterium]
MRTTSLRLFSVSLGLAALAVSMSATPAATVTWNGNGANGNWTTGANWIGGTAPTGTGSGDTLVFGNGSNRLSSTNTVANFQLASGTSLRFTNSSNYTLTGSSLVLNGPVSQSGASAVTIANDIALTGERTFSLANGGGSINVTGNISGGSTAGINKTGGGTLILSGSNSYVGSTIVSLGTLVVNGTNTASGVTVTAGATLLGTGRIGATSVEGTINAGSGTAAGILKVDSLSMLPDSTAKFTITGTGQGIGYNSIKSTGSIDLGNTNLDLVMNNTSLLPNYSTYKLFDAATVTGNIAGIPNVTYVGNELTFSESTSGSGRWLAYDPASDQTLVFDASNGTLTVVPEPSSMIMLAMAGGVAGVFGMRRRKTNKVATTK